VYPGRPNPEYTDSLLRSHIAVPWCMHDVLPIYRFIPFCFPAVPRSLFLFAHNFVIHMPLWKSMGGLARSGPSPLPHTSLSIITHQN